MYTLGQRWISDAEPDLGLGTIVEIETRQIEVIFPASGQKRRYAQATAPLSRVEFAEGDFLVFVLHLLDPVRGQRLSSHASPPFVRERPCSLRVNQPVP